MDRLDGMDFEQSRMAWLVTWTEHGWLTQGKAGIKTLFRDCNYTDKNCGQKTHSVKISLRIFVSVISFHVQTFRNFNVQ